MTAFSVSRQDVLGDMDASAISVGIRRGDFSVAEVIAAAQLRLAEANPVLGATACRLDAVLSRLERLAVTGPFAGVPSLIKDNTDIAGVPTRHGSRATPATAARADSRVTRQHLACGLLPIAKTTLPEFGLTATTEFSRSPPTRNPWHTDHSAGGSSGGSASLVAAGVVPIAHANDGGGSIRIPAACCGLVGLKPSRHRLRAHEMGALLPVKLVADGVVTRSVRDTAGFFAAAERDYRNPDLPPIGEVLHATDQPLRIGFYSTRPDGMGCDPQCQEAVESAARLCESLGHQVEQISAPFDQQMADDFLIYWGMLAASVKWLGPWLVQRDFNRALIEPLTGHLASHFRASLHRLPAVIARLRHFQRRYAQVMTRHDLLLTPTLAEPPPPIGHLALDLPADEAFERLRRYAVFTPAQNVSGAPAISLPLGRSDTGLPIGVQFAAGVGQERRLLELALALEEAAPWPQFPTLQAGRS